MSKVVIRSVTKSFGAVAVLRAISFDVEDASLLTLLGPSGCGKTTLLRLVAGLEDADRGMIIVAGRPVFDPEKGVHVAAADRNIGMVFQSYALWPHKRVWENVAYPLKVRHVSRDLMRSRVSQALRLVQLDGLGDRFPGELSGGQQQRVALARAIVYEPDVLLLDEPLSNLDAKLRAEMRYEIRELQQRCRLTTIYVTHDQEEAFAISDKVCLMNGGALEQIGDGIDLYEMPRTRFAADFVGGANQVPGEVIAPGDSTRTIVKLAEGWCICARHSGLLAKGTKVRVLIRPHDILLERTDRVRAGGVRATVGRITYLGAGTEYLISIGRLELRARDIGPPRFSRGQPVVASVGDDRCLAFDDFSG